MARALQNVDYCYGLTDMAGLTMQHVVRNKQRFVRKLRILTRNNFWDVSRWLAGAYASSSDHLDQHKKPVLIRDHKIKWLDFGTTPDEGNLSPHPGLVWMKAGYSESIEWRIISECEMFSACLCADFAALVLKNVTTYPTPPTHTFLKWPFLTDFKKYTYPPLWNEILVLWTKN